MNPIKVASKHLMKEKLAKRYPNAKIIDITSKGEEPFVKFSPFYPIGGVPIPFSEGILSESVEGLWQGLKVFETAEIDPSKFEVTTMKGLKRTVRRFGQCLGHQIGVNIKELLGYIEARKLIYLPAYLWVLENKLQTKLDELRVLANASELVLLDYETNGNVEERSKPLSHAWLVKHYLDENWPVFE